jgi:hypothetical protein
MNGIRRSCHPITGKTGIPKGFRQRAAEQMKKAAQAARNFIDTKPAQGMSFPAVVAGFTGSSLACLLRISPNESGFLSKGV